MDVTQPKSGLEAFLRSLRGLAIRQAPQAATLLEQALEYAARPLTSEQQATRLDREAVRALTEALTRDAILEHLAPETMAHLLERSTARLEIGPAESRSLARAGVWQVLDLVRRTAFLQRIAEEEREAWAQRILAAVDGSHFTLGPLFRQRVEEYSSRILFNLPRSERENASMRWSNVALRVQLIARGLLALDPDGEPGPVAILSENRLEMALADLACLTSGIVNVMVPANSTEADVEFILRHCRARTVMVSNQRQLQKFTRCRDALPDLRHVISLDPTQRNQERMTCWSELLAGAESVPASQVTDRSNKVRSDDLASIMYTSGTTGTPKAIQFSQRNLVFKRFARALALPEIGDRDTFLCFLPLFHTFGRFFEMLGCIFWGATYCFIENPSVDALIRSMQRYRPTVFISVPKKWIQLYETIRQRVDNPQASDEELQAVTDELTGGKLRWGLSAAGYLDAEIFRFFQARGTELMSGFGMTEATGGITMTPPGRYRDDSLGGALPGIELKLAEDGELLVRGGYVMMGYLDPVDGRPSFDEEGWFHTGDLMVVDDANFIRLVDRKKEIYKNVKGETIAPQRIENLFRDLESVGRAFLVGDHREYNTLLIYPNPDSHDIELASLSTDDLRDHFRSLVVSVNKFLAPYERIVDFALIDRDLDPEQGELTEKGTPRRKTVTKNFDDQIRTLYRRIHLHVGGVEVILPNWLLQALGMTAQDLTVEGDLLQRTGADPVLSIEALDEEYTRVGDVVYGHPPGPLDIGALLSAPRLWLGNGPLVDFLPLEPAERQRPGRTASEIRWIKRRASHAPTKEQRAELVTLGNFEAWQLEQLDAAVRLLASADESIALEALECIVARVGSDENRLAGPARWALARIATHGTLDLRRRALVHLVTLERDSRFDEMLRRFLDGDGILLDDGTRQAIAQLNLTPAKIAAWISASQNACLTAHDETSRAFSLLQLLADYGSAHPTSYRTLRAALVRMQMIAPNETVRLAAREAAMTLRDGFRRWLGPSSLVAVDPETGEEYAWSDVVAFDDTVPVADRDRLMIALRETTLLREALFLFSKGIVIRLSDIPRGGVWVRLLGQRHGKTVHRITVHTRHQGSHDLAINVNHELTEKQVYEEIHWLILSGGTASREPLVEDFGGYWQQTDLWSEEFVPGDTLARGLKRMARDRDPERLAKTWPFLAWTALSAYVDFWNRSGKRWEIADPSMTNVVVPMDDFKHGVRIVSVTSRRHHSGLPGMIRSFRDEFIRPAETLYPVLEDLVGWDIIFSSILEVSGEEEGVNLLQRMLDQKQNSLDNELRSALEIYLAAIQSRGFRPRRLYFAIERYGRWRNLGDDPTREARARTLRELYDTYNLAEMDREYPWTRIRFFLDTVFGDSNDILREGLETLISQIRNKLLVGDERVDAIAELRAKLKHGEDDDYFLARLSYPYLLPEDAAAFVSGTLAGNQQSEMVVTLEDNDGQPFQVRHALSPREVGYLHRLFLAAKLDVRFRAEHRYLVAIGERDQLIGGIFYELEEESEAHLEKIVVMERFRRKGVADGLMKQLFNRLISIGIKTVTTGFFRPEYFYSYGFTIEKHYAGLVKALEVQDDPNETT